MATMPSGLAKARRAVPSKRGDGRNDRPDGVSRAMASVGPDRSKRDAFLEIYRCMLRNGLSTIRAADEAAKAAGSGARPKDVCRSR